MELIKDIAILFGLVLLQNASFTLVSRARNSSSLMYHALAAIGSNGIWLLVIRRIILNPNNVPLMITYVIAAVIGSISMHYIAMRFFEKKKPFVQKPSIGRIVNFNVLHNIVFPAIIVRVHNETCVDLEVFGLSSKQQTSIVQGKEYGQWNWPMIK